ncbi:MAG: shikimate kinase [Acidobacteriota bacterium]
MRILVFGNSGSGKSTYAKALVRTHRLAHLDLDSIVWAPGQIAVERPRHAVRESISMFLRENLEWVIEGCYGELIEEALPHCTRLVFLNPGLEVCLRNNRHRPWEPHKYASAAGQDAMFDALQYWVTAYYTRDDALSLAYHRRLFDSYHGEKEEILASRECVADP